MRPERYVVLGLAQVRATWFAELGRWATAGAAPMDFVKCVSPEEVRARLGTGRAVSALVADATRVGVERDLIDLARDAGCAVIVVDDGHRGADWITIGAAAVLAPGFTRTELIDVLARHAAPIGRIDEAPIELAGPSESPWRGRLIAVTGPGGTGASTVAMATAQALGSDPRNRGLVLLADLALHAELAMLHDARDVVPGLLELVDACRNGAPASGVADLVFRVDDRHYDLLLGLRRHRDWTALRRRAFELALETLRNNYRLVVTDVGCDTEGEGETGSADVADRNHMCSHSLRVADLVVVVGVPGVKGMHALVRTVQLVHAAGVSSERIVPIVNQAGRSPRQRAQISDTYRALCDLGEGTGEVAGPIFVGSRRHLDDLVSQAAPLPDAMCRPLGAAVGSMLARLPRVRGVDGHDEPAAVVPGSLGTWNDAEGAA